MLYVIVTDEHGRVKEAIPCRTVEHAISVIADRLTHPEDDAAEAFEVIAEAWEAAILDAEDYGGEPTEHFVMSRGGYSHRYGLIATTELARGQARRGLGH